MLMYFFAELSSYLRTRDIRGRTVLILAAEGGHSEVISCVVDMLKENGKGIALALPEGISIVFFHSFRDFRHAEESSVHEGQHWYDGPNDGG